MQIHTKASLRPFLGRVINNAIKYKKYTKLVNGIIIHLDNKSGLGEEFFNSLISQKPFFIYKTRGWRVTLFTGLGNQDLYICLKKSEESFN